MGDVVLTKGSDGKLHGLGDADERAWSRFVALVRRLQDGDTLRFTWREPRSLPHHRLFFAKLKDLFERQELFSEPDRLRHWLLVGAGYCDLLPGPQGDMVAIPQSISFERLDEVEFAELHRRVDEFLWTARAQRALWPHLSAQQRWEMVEQLRLSFDRR